MLDIGMILKATNEENALFPGYARLVGTKDDGGAWLIRLDVPENRNLQVPFRVSVQDLIDGLNSGDVLSGLEFDMGLPASESQLSKFAYEKMEKNYAVLKPLLADETLVYDSEHRSREFSKIATESNMSARNIRRLYYQYLAGGMTQLAVAPGKSGCPGEDQEKGTERRGPKANKSIQCEVGLPDLIEKLEKGARKYYLSGQYTLLEAYVATLKQYFPSGMKMVEDVDGKKKLEEIILPPQVRPTFMQFRYLCEKLEKKEGKRKFKPRRARQSEDPWQFRGNARKGIFGPGARFEIDATKLQIQLVSRYGSAKLVGSPTLYVLIDVWSGAYVGYALSLENAGWALAARALHCAFQEKELLFQRLGLPYTNEDWPCCQLPTRLTADRAELISDKAGLVPEIGIKVEIMPPMCPEAKGSVESAIKEVKHGRSKKLPGTYAKKPGRREPDGKADAALTLDQLEEIIIRQIMKLNDAPVQLKNIPHQMLQNGETYITRIGLYKWGLANCPGYTRKLTAKEIYTNLLSRDFASVTPRGIFYKSQIYFSDTLAENGFLARAAVGHFPVEIRFDEHLADQIWFLDEDSNDWLPAIVDNDDIRRLKIAFFELESFNTEAKQLIDQTKLENVHQGLENEKLDDPIIKDAKRRAKAARIGVGKTEGRSKMRKNKQIDRDANRLIEGEHVVGSYTKAISVARSSIVEEFDDEPIQRKKSITALSGEIWGKLK
ncbi:MAG: hypothetical protein JZU65_12410 [Chlorobium sp.]|nr:hypothetical protein [Chlorobium sp.]